MWKAYNRGFTVIFLISFLINRWFLPSSTCPPCLKIPRSCIVIIVKKWQFNICKWPIVKLMALKNRRFCLPVTSLWPHCIFDKCCHINDDTQLSCLFSYCDVLSLVLLPSCRQLILLLDLYSARDIYDYLRPIAFSLCADKVSSVRWISYKLVKQSEEIVHVRLKSIGGQE